MMTEKEMYALVNEVKEAVEKAAALKATAQTEEQLKEGMAAAATAINKANSAIEKVMGQLGC